MNRIGRNLYKAIAFGRLCALVLEPLLDAVSNAPVLRVITSERQSTMEPVRG